MRKNIIYFLILILLTFPAYSIGCDGNSCVNSLGLNPIRHWRMNETGAISDDGVLIDYTETESISYQIDSGTASISQINDVWGNVNGAKRFIRGDNVNEAYIKDPDNSDDLGFNSNFTINLWINPIDLITEQWILACENSGSFSWDIRLNAGNINVRHNTNEQVMLSTTKGWQMLTIRGNGTRLGVFINGSNKADVVYSPLDLSTCDVSSAQLSGGNYYHNINLSMSDISIYTTALTNNNIKFLYDGIEGDPDTVSVTKKTQSPDDIKLSSFGLINITYNITATQELNQSTIKLFHKTNTTQKDYSIYINDSAYITGFNEISYIKNDSSIYEFNLYENLVFPAIYNINESLMINTLHSMGSIGNNEFIKIEFLNVNNSNRNNFF